MVESMYCDVVLSIALQKLNVLENEEASLLYLSGVHGMTWRLVEIIRGLQLDWTESDKKQEISDPNVRRKCMADIIDAAYDLGNLLDRVVYTTSRRGKRSTFYCISYLQNLKRMRSLAREMERIHDILYLANETLKEVQEKGKEQQPQLPEAMEIDKVNNVQEQEEESNSGKDNDIELTAASRIRVVLLYLGMFPSGMDIPKRRIFQLWLAEGFLSYPSPNLRYYSPEKMAELLLADLVSREMIVESKFRSDGSAKTFRISEKLGDSLLSKAEEIGLCYIHQKLASQPASTSTSTSTSQFRVHRVVEYADIKDYPPDHIHDSDSELYVQHLRSYISFNFQKKDTQALQIGKFVSKIIGKRGYAVLRVLDLEGVYKPALPQELGNLYYLRYLGLRWTFLDTLPSSVRNLSGLQTLDIKHTYIRTLPISLSDMKFMRHLYLNDITLDISVLSNTTDNDIQTLSGFFVDKKSRVSKWGCLRELKKLGLTCYSSSTPELGLWISKLTSLRSLKLRSKDDKEMGKPSSLHLSSLVELNDLTYIYLMGKLPNLQNLFPRNLMDLTLSVSLLEVDPMPMLGELPKLAGLRLLANSYSGNKMVCEQGSFRSLLIVKLWMLENLEDWVVNEEAMPNLRELEIRRCHKLKNIPAALVGSSTLKQLTLTKMPGEFVADTEDYKSKRQASMKIDVTWEMKVNP